MLFSNGAIIISVNTDKIKNLKNVSFEKNNKFYSFFIKSTEKLSIGEFHWSESFLHGKINIVNFTKVNNYFILYTSTVQNYLEFKQIIEYILGENSNVVLMKLPLPVPIKQLAFPEIKHLETDEAFGLTLIFSICNEELLVKIYTNGLITYSMLTNIDYNDALKMFMLILKIIEVYNE
jgi:hypothetical protein